MSRPTTFDIQPLDPITAAWLEAGPTILPDVTRRAIAAGVRTAPQRRGSVLTRTGGTTMNRFQLLGLAGAMAAITLVGTLAIAGPQPPLSVPPVSASTTASPVATNSSTPPTTGLRFTSHLYGYSLTLPADWTAVPATEAFTASKSWSALGSTADFFSGGPPPLIQSWQPWFAVKALDIPSRTTAAAWADANVPYRDEQWVRALEGNNCVFGPQAGSALAGRAGTSGIPMGLPPEWRDASIGGQPARLRAACGFVDAVVVVGDRAYLFSMFIGRDGNNKTGPFDAIASTVEFDADDLGRVTSFRSSMFGYLVNYPAGWEVTAATKPWSPRSPHDEPTWSVAGDRFVNPNRPANGSPWVLSIVSAPVARGLTDQEWVDRYLPERYESDGGLRHCPGGNQWRGDAPRGDWEPATFDERLGRMRASCGFVDGVVIVDGRAWVITAEGPVQWLAGDRTVEVFKAFAANLELRASEAADQPEGTAPPATGSVMFTSPLYGYSVEHPADWIMEPATEQWPGRWITTFAGADVLTDPDTDPDSQSRTMTWFSVRAIAVQAGTSAAGWAEANVSRRPALEEQGPPRHRHCRFSLGNGGVMFVETGWSDEWRDASIGGEPARLRAACGFVDAVVVVHGRAYLFSMFTYPGNGANTIPFEAIAKTVDFGAD